MYVYCIVHEIKYIFHNRTKISSLAVYDLYICEMMFKIHYIIHLAQDLFSDYNTDFFFLPHMILLAFIALHISNTDTGLIYVEYAL